MKFFRLPGKTDAVPEVTKGWKVDNGRRIGVALGLIVYRMRIVGLSKVPPSGPVVFVINHSTMLDGPVLFGYLPRRVSFLVKAEMFSGFMGWLLTTVGQYGLNRDIPDRGPLMKALAQLKAGGTVGIFPEGTRGDGGVAAVFNGAGWLALRSGAAVVPIAIRGTKRPEGGRRRLRPKVDVLIGEVFTVGTGAGKTAVESATEQIHEKLKSLVDELDTRRASA